MIHPKVFRVSFQGDVHHRLSTFGGMDSEYSHTTREQVSHLVVAPDIETAQFLWAHNNRGITSRTDISWETVGSVDLLFANGYGI